MATIRTFAGSKLSSYRPPWVRALQVGIIIVDGEFYLGYKPFRIDVAIQGIRMANLAYYRCSSLDSSVEAQRHVLPGPFEREFLDEGVSGIISAANRSGFASMLSYMREGDTVHVCAIDRLGRDSIDIQTVYRDHFKAKGVRLYVAGLGYIEGEMGEIVFALMAQFAQMERNRIVTRTNAGKARAREALASTGKTHNGKSTMGGRPRLYDPAIVRAWRQEHDASISMTAAHFKISTASVKAYCRAEKPS